MSCHFSHFTCPPSYEGYTSPDTFFSLTFIKERIWCKIICYPKTEHRKYVCRSGLLHFNSPDLNSKHLRVSAQKFFSLVSLCSCIRIEKKLVLYSLKSWESVRKPRLLRKQSFLVQNLYLSFWFSGISSRAHMGPILGMDTGRGKIAGHLF